MNAVESRLFKAIVPIHHKLTLIWIFLRETFFVLLFSIFGVCGGLVEKPPYDLRTYIGVFFDYSRRIEQKLI